MDLWLELSPSRREMLATLLKDEGVSETSAALTFKRGDLSWGLKRKLVAKRPYRDWQEFYITEAGKTALKRPQH